MINHLSSEQMSRMMTGQAQPDEAQHAAECVDCAAEITSLQETLAVFRDSVQHWSYRNGGSDVPDPAFVRTDLSAFSLHPVRWALAAAALIMVVMIPVYKNISDRHRALQAEDAFLLEQVNSQLSRTVPEALEPLMMMLSDAGPDEVGGRQ